MGKFKENDKVKVIKLGEVSFIVEIGDIGIVERIYENDDFPIRVKINDESDYGFKENELEFVNEEVKEELSFIEVCQKIKNGEIYRLVQSQYRLKEITCKNDILEFISSDDPVRVGQNERYVKLDIE